MNARPYYVYVYIDPRNYEEFYYGKGTGSRRSAHLKQEGDSEKIARIKAIQKEGLEPIIRTIATGLNEAEAHLIETTLIWKLGRGLMNAAAGRYVSLFRPHNTLHKDLPTFDYHNAVYYFNVGDGPHRTWEDCKKFGFLSAGQGKQWRDQILGVGAGDVVVAYLKGHGFVGVGKVKEAAKPYLEFRIKGCLLHEHDIEAEDMTANCHNDSKCEYVLRVKWLKAVPRAEAKFARNSHLYTTTHIRASLANQQKTLKVH